MNQEIYQDIILSHFRGVKGKGDLSGQEHVFTIKNPYCGDVVKLHISLDEAGENIRLIHDSQGCAASIASCSIMCETLQGLSIEQATKVVSAFLLELESERSLQPEQNVSIELESLLFFRKVPARKLCVSLAWTCAENALADLNKEA